MLRPHMPKVWHRNPKMITEAASEEPQEAEQLQIAKRPDKGHRGDRIAAYCAAAALWAQVGLTVWITFHHGSAG
jgi:hypothetical protein